MFIHWCLFSATLCDIQYVIYVSSAENEVNSLKCVTVAVSFAYSAQGWPSVSVEVPL